MKKFQVNDRVRRLPYSITVVKGTDLGHTGDGSDVESTVVSTRGPIGTVKALREETTNTKGDNRERSLMIHVLWDNGTLSYHGPEALEHA